MAAVSEVRQASARQSFPTQRRLVRRQIDLSKPLEELQEWVKSTGLKIGPLVPQSDLHELLSLFWTYRDIESKEIRDMGPPTDLIIHRASIKAGTPVYKSKPKRYAPDKEWWYRKIVTEGIENGMYERTVVANGRMSPWAADAVLVKKAGKDEPRLTFNYHNVWEEPPGSLMETAEKTHEFLSSPSHGCFSKFDLKNAYWTVAIHPEDRYYFAFFCPGLGQLQPTRMPQGARTSSFTMNELGCIAFGDIPSPSPEPSLIAPSRTDLQHMTFYIDDLFPAHKDWPTQFAFLKDHLLPRLLWSRLRLSFSKVEIGSDKVVALGVLHQIGGRLDLKPDRVRVIAEWPTPQNASDIRSFNGTIASARRWVKNFADIGRPLSRLTGKKVPWHWGEAEQVSFDLLRNLCAAAACRHGWTKTHPVQMFVDASKFAIGCYIVQVIDGVTRPIFYDSQLLSPPERNYDTYKRELKAIVTFVTKHGHMMQHPELSTVWTDHKPLTGFINSEYHEDIFARWAQTLRRHRIKIQHIPGVRNRVADGLSRTIFDKDCEASEITGALKESLANHGDDPKQVWFWKSGKGGYEDLLKSMSPKPPAPAKGVVNEHHDQPATVGWTTFGIPEDPPLQCLASETRARRSTRNQTQNNPTSQPQAPILVPPRRRGGRKASKTPQAQTEDSPPDAEAPKPSKGGTNEPLKEPAAKAPHVPDTNPQKTVDGAQSLGKEASVPVAKDSETPLPSGDRREERKQEFSELRRSWYYDLEQYYRYQITNPSWTRAQHFKFKRAAEQFRWSARDRCLLHQRGDHWVMCIDPHMVAEVLDRIHDQSGHFGARIILEKIQHRLFWPNMLKDVYEYIKGCFDCARIAAARRVRPLSPILSLRPWQIMVMDTIESLPTTSTGYRSCLVMVDYFSKFVITRPGKTWGSEEIINALRSIFHTYTTPTSIYADQFGAFHSVDTKNFLKSVGCSISPVPSQAHRSAGLVEITNRNLENRLIASQDHASMMKEEKLDHLWDQRLDQATYDMNHHYIAALGYSAAELALSAGGREFLDLEVIYPSPMTTKCKEVLQMPEDELQDEDLVLEAVQTHMVERADSRQEMVSAHKRDQDARQLAFDRYKTNHPISTGDKVLVWKEQRESHAGYNKLNAVWRGPYVVTGPGGGHGMSWTISSITSGRYIGHFHVEHLRKLSERSPHLRPISPKTIIVPETLKGVSKRSGATGGHSAQPPQVPHTAPKDDFFDDHIKDIVQQPKLSEERRKLDERWGAKVKENHKEKLAIHKEKLLRGEKVPEAERRAMERFEQSIQQLLDKQASERRRPGPSSS